MTHPTGPPDGRLDVEKVKERLGRATSMHTYFAVRPMALDMLIRDALAVIEALERERDSWHAIVEADSRRIATLEEAARFPRNAIIQDEGKFAGAWIAVPRRDFDKLRQALAGGGSTR